MGRSLIIVGLVALLMATGVASAAPGENVRLPVAVAPGQAEAADSVVVAPGDHLWKISARHLDTVAPGQRVAPYWRVVVEANAPSLRSGDPDLIYPGEVIDLPPLSERP